MTSWLKSIQAEADAIEITDSDAPPAEETPGDHVVGMATDELKKLFLLMVRYAQKIAESNARGVSANSALREEEKKNTLRLKLQLTVIRDIFWVSCRATFPELWDRDCIGIRKSWEVVWSDVPEKISFGSALREMLGDFLEGEEEESVGDEAATTQ